jgi:hypothetical protein
MLDEASLALPIHLRTTFRFAGAADPAPSSLDS